MIIRNLKQFAVLLASISVLGAVSARAADPAAETPISMVSVTPEMQELAKMNRIGGGLMLEPNYPGAKGYRVSPLPDIDYTYENRFFINSVDGVGLFLFNNDRLSVGTSLYFRENREAGQDNALRGLPGIPWVGQARLVTQYDFGWFNIGGAIVHDLGGATGTQYELRAATAIPVTDKLFVLPGLTATFDDRKFAQSWFGVSPAASAGSGYRIYQPASGFESITPILNIAYRFDQSWIGFLKSDFKYYADMPGKSPLVQQRWQPTFGIGVSYLFK